MDFPVVAWPEDLLRDYHRKEFEVEFRKGTLEGTVRAYYMLVHGGSERRQQSAAKSSTESLAEVRRHMQELDRYADAWLCGCGTTLFELVAQKLQGVLASPIPNDADEDRLAAAVFERGFWIETCLELLRRGAKLGLWTELDELGERAMHHLYHEMDEVTHRVAHVLLWPRAEACLGDEVLITYFLGMPPVWLFGVQYARGLLDLEEEGLLEE